MNLKVRQREETSVQWHFPLNVIMLRACILSPPTGVGKNIWGIKHTNVNCLRLEKGIMSHIFPCNILCSIKTFLWEMQQRQEIFVKQIKIVISWTHVHLNFPSSQKIWDNMKSLKPIKPKTRGGGGGHLKARRWMFSGADWSRLLEPTIWCELS